MLRVDLLRKDATRKQHNRYTGLLTPIERPMCRKAEVVVPKIASNQLFQSSQFQRTPAFQGGGIEARNILNGMNKTLLWRGKFDNAEYHALHSDAFGPIDEDGTVDWQYLTEKHSLGWVTARDSEELVGFVNVVWDGHLHAWIQDLMVASDARHQGIGTDLMQEVRNESSKAGCEWLHADFEDHLAAFYVDACGFASSSAALTNLKGLE